MKACTFCLAGLFLFIPLQVLGDIYQWTDEDGVVHFSERPPPDEPCEEIELDESVAPSSVDGEDTWAEEWLEQQRREREEAKALRRAEIETDKAQSAEDCAIAMRMLSVLELECPVFYDSEGVLHARCPNQPVWVPKGEIRFIDDAERQAMLEHYGAMRERCGDRR
jgi:hypothetical protein